MTIVCTQSYIIELHHSFKLWTHLIDHKCYINMAHSPRDTPATSATKVWRLFWSQHIPSETSQFKLLCSEFLLLTLFKIYAVLHAVVGCPICIVWGRISSSLLFMQSIHYSFYTSNFGHWFLILSYIIIFIKDRRKKKNWRLEHLRAKFLLSTPLRVWIVPNILQLLHTIVDGCDCTCYSYYSWM